MRSTARFCARRVAAALLLFTGLAGPMRAADAADDDLRGLDLESLMALEITSVSKRAQSLSHTPAAVSVITGEQLRRSGHRSLPEALRMVPGLQVAHIDASKWAVSSRGFNDLLSNKLLVMIDGRSIYTPFFSGVFWDAQDVLFEDIERIEVVRGPGGTLWGANAVNGVINVITKPASETQGFSVTAGLGTQEKFAGSVRFGGAAGDNLHYRTWAKGFIRDNFRRPNGDEARDAWDAQRGGFRIDWAPSDRDDLTFLGELHNGHTQERNPLGKVSPDFNSANLLGRWAHSFSEDSVTQLQLYYDRSEHEFQGSKERRDILDVDFQHDYSLTPRHALSWGAAYRLTFDRIRDDAVVAFHPSRRTDHLLSAFVQSQYDAIPERLVATLGTKIEYNDYSGFEYQPSARIRFTPTENQTLWAAVSRAVRTPARQEASASFNPPPLPGLPPFLVAQIRGNEDFEAENLLAYELGYRNTPRREISIDLTAYFFEYSGIHTFEPGPLEPAGFTSTGGALPPFTIPLNIDNKLDATSFGVEVEAGWKPREFLELTVGYTYFNLDLDFRNPVSISFAAEGREPSHQAHIRSFLDLPRGFELDAALYYVENLSSEVDASGKPIGAHVRGDLRLGWRISEELDLSVVGQNLFENRTAEFGHPLVAPSQVPRSVFAEVRWRR